MRQQPSGGSYAAGTKIDAHRSRVELQQLLARYGGTDFVVLEHDANATIRFALHGKYVQYVLPLPEFESPEFTHTPGGRPRKLAAHERAYEQAVRQQWRRAVLVMKGKLEAIESGLSPFEREFYGAIQDDDRREKPAALLLRRRLRWAPETMLVILCLGVLVPAGGAVALGVPAVAVEHLAAPALGDSGDLGRRTKDSNSGGHTLRLAAAPSSAGAAHAPVDAGSSHGGTQLVAASTGGNGSGGNGTSGGSSAGAAGGGDSEPAGGHSAPPDDPGQGQGKPDDPGQGNGPPDNPGNGNGNGQSDNPGNGNGNGNGQSANPGNGNGNANANANAYGQDKPDKPGQGQEKPNGNGGAAQSQAPDPGPANGQGKSQGEQNGKGAGGPSNGKK